MTTENQSIDEILDYGLNSEIIGKTTDRKKWSKELNYGDLKVTEESIRGGSVQYSLDFEEYGILEIRYSFAGRENKNIYLIEALSQGKNFNIKSEIFESDYPQKQIYDWGLTDVLEHNKIPEEYREPLNEFMHDIFWE